MRAAGTPEEFEAEPIGHWVTERSLLVWSWSPSLVGTAMWGRPNEDDFVRLYRLVDAYHAASGTHCVVTDVSRIDGVDEDAYRVLMKGMQDRSEVFKTRVLRHAIIRSGGLVGGLTEGFNPLIDARHQWKTFGEPRAAFEWLGHPEGEQARVEVQRLVDQARGESADLRRVRDYLKVHLAAATLLDMARSLGMSERSAQRVLRQAGTCFRDELGAARVEAAQGLLRDGKLKIEEIARRVGCSSHAHFSSLFKRATGRSPADFREQMRAAAPPAQPGSRGPGSAEP